MQEIFTVLFISFDSILPFSSIFSFHSIQLIYLFRHDKCCKSKSVNTKLLIRAYLQIIPIHLADTVKLQLPCHFHNPQYCLHSPRYDISKVCAPFENLLYTYSEKSELSRVLWSKIFRKWKYCQKIYVFFSSCRTIMKGKSQKICLFFTETCSIKQYRE